MPRVHNASVPEAGALGQSESKPTPPAPTVDCPVGLHQRREQEKVKSEGGKSTKLPSANQHMKKKVTEFQ